MANPRETTVKHCENCSDDIDTSDWYPVVNERDGDGDLVFHYFCSPECKASWTESRSD